MTTGSDNTHARLAPSDSKRWTQCTAAIAFCEANAHRVPPDTGSRYADEGTRAHEYAADVLTGKKTLADVPDADGSTDKDFPHVDYRTPVGDYVAHCLALMPEGGKPMVEVQVPLFYQPEQSGTCDFAAIVPDGSGGWKVFTRDLKFGQGVLVTSDSNTQLAIYTLSLIRLLEDVYDFGPDTPINLAVFQPRHREGADQAPWELTLAELEDFGKEIEYRATQARVAADRVKAKLPCGQRDIGSKEILEAAPGAKFHPGEGDDSSCRWCDAKGVCDARLSFIAAEMGDDHDIDLQRMLAEMPDLTKEEKKLPPEERVEAVMSKLGHDGPLTDELLVAMAKQAEAVHSFLADVAGYLESRALEGRAAPGTFLVMGRPGNRAWADEAAADTFLTGQKLSADDRYTKSLISPTQAEKLLKDKLEKTRTANRFAKLVTRSEPKKVLAFDGDKRQPVEADVSMFENLDEEFEI